MQRRDFIKTSAGFMAFSLAPGIWNIQVPLPKAKKYKFQKYTLTETLAPVTRITPDDGFYVHTYFDVTPFSPSQKLLVVSKLPYQDHWPKTGDTADVCIIDLENESIRKVYSTKCWEYQTGTNAQWGNSDRYIYTNDVINNEAVCVRVDIETGDTTAFSGPMYDVAPDESCVVAFPLELMDVTQLGYGLASKDPAHPPSLPRGASMEQGVWKTDLKTNKKELLVSLADVAAKVPEKPPQEDHTFYFWHAKFNPQGTRISTVLRCVMPGRAGGVNPMVFTYKADGTDIQYTTPQYPLWGQGGGHPNWHPNGDYIIRHLKMEDGVSRYCQAKYDGSEFKVLSKKLQGTGHPSIEPSGRFLITDSFNKTGGNWTVSMKLMDLHADKEEAICTIPTLPKPEGSLEEVFRLDGHPVWNRDYKKVCLQAAHEGKRSLFMIDLSKTVLIVILCLFACGNLLQAQSKPNVILIVADDMGYGDLSCYGQKKFETPNIDNLAKQGIRYTQAYSGTAVCAPSRCALMTGFTTGHTYVRGNHVAKDVRPSLPDSVFTMAELMKQAGYKTGLYGKWGLGNEFTSGSPVHQGFDDFYGYYDQEKAHYYYPDTLWHNETPVQLAGNMQGKKGVLAADWYFNGLTSFIRQNASSPFFIFFATTIPHNYYEMPVKPQFDSKDWTPGQKIYASMITHLDEQVGIIVKLLKDLKLDKNTIILFTSDNGPAIYAKDEERSYALNPSFFNSSAGFRGVKRDVYEGGIRVPMIVKWNGAIKPNTVSGYPWAFWDIMPTLADITKQKTAAKTDGISVLPSWLGQKQAERPYLYWEFHMEDKNNRFDFKQAVRMGNWKAVRNSVKEEIELYDISKDPYEKTNVAISNPAIVEKAKRIFTDARTESPIWKVKWTAK